MSQIVGSAALLLTYLAWRVVSLQVPAHPKEPGTEVTITGVMIFWSLLVLTPFLILSTTGHYLDRKESPDESL